MYSVTRCAARRSQFFNRSLSRRNPQRFRLNFLFFLAKYESSISHA